MLMRARGPDSEKETNALGYTFRHFLLSIESAAYSQPVDTDEYTVLFNGELYNFKHLSDKGSEVEVLLELYDKEGFDGLRLLDGEYAIVLFDKKRKVFVALTDPFGTKPLFYGRVGGRACFASYKSVLVEMGCLNIQHLSPNKIFEISYSSGKCIKILPNYRFNLRQDKNSFDRWCDLFECAVRKRYRHGRDTQDIFIGMSSGYDSGAIAAALRRLNLSFNAFSVTDDTNISIIRDRFESCKNLKKQLFLRDWRENNLSVTDDIENYEFRIFSDSLPYIEQGSSTKTDRGALGLAEICSMAKKLNWRIYLSGGGADEIYSDYGFGGKAIYSHSNFGGTFPENLATIFPWASVYGSSMRSYLMKEELVAGFYGVEGRYPFLDVQLTQEFLNLKSELKNGEYKAPIAYYLSATGFPYDRQRKLGF
jgi:asparagine synthetase B (glutamine-hydrolysing)